MPLYSYSLFPSGFPIKNLYALPLMLATCPAHIILPDLINLIKETQ
jgi:hypothetical protein